MNEIFEMPDGIIVGTGLQIPVGDPVGAFPLYEDSGPMLTRSSIEDIAKSGKARGKGRFGSNYIKNQRDKGSCQGFASAAALTRARVRRRLKRVDLSGAYAYSLVNGGNDNGSMLLDGMQAMVDKGIATEATVPWDKIYPHLYNKAKADAEAARFKGIECYAVRTELGLFSALALGFDCVVAVHVEGGSTFMRLDSRGVAGGGNGPGNHAVGADGLWWDNGLIADGYNSWDVAYGDEGRMGLTWDRFFQNTTKWHVFFAVRSTTDDPADLDNPPSVVI